MYRICVTGSTAWDFCEVDGLRKRRLSIEWGSFHREPLRMSSVLASGSW